MENKHVIAVDIGGTKALAAVVRLDNGSIIREKRGLTNTASEQAFANGITGLIKALLQDSPGIEPLGIGIGTAGFVNIKDQTVTSMNLGVTELPLSRLIGDAFGLPVVMDNDGNAGALGEGSYGSARGKQYFAYVSVGTGIGMGLVLDGKLYRGKGNNSGELGHVGIDINGEACKCHGVGCLENISSGTGIAMQATKLLTEGKLSPDSFPHGVDQPTTEDVVVAAKQGNQHCLAVINHAAMALGYSLRNLNNLLDLEMVVLGGGVAMAYPHFLAEVERHANKSNMLQQAGIPVKLSALGSQAILFGATALINQEIRKQRENL